MNWTSATPWLLLVIVIELLGFLEGSFAVHIRPRADSRRAIRRLYWMTIATCVSLCILLGVFVAHQTTRMLGYAAWFASTLAFVFQGVDEAKAEDPAEFFIVTIFGATTNIIKRAGQRFFPLRGLVFGGIKVKAELITEEITTEDGLPGVSYLTADNIEGGAVLSVSYFVNANVHGPTVKDINGQDVIPARNFITAGKENGVRKFLEQKVIAAFIKFMKGIAHWNDVTTLDNGAIEKLVKAIADGDGMPRIPSSVPTDILMKFYGLVKGPYTEKEKEEFLKETPGTSMEDAIRSRIDADKTGPEAKNAEEMISQRRECGDEDVPDDYEAFLKIVLQERFQMLEDLKAGHAKIPIDSLGITLVKVNIGERSFDPDVLESFSEKTREEAQRDAEKIRAEARREQADAMYGDGKDFGGSKKDAYELALVDDAKMDAVHKSYSVNVNLTADEDMKEVIKKIGPSMGPALGATVGAAIAEEATRPEAPKTTRKKGGKKS